MRGQLRSDGSRSLTALGDADLKLHLGCGPDVRPGWVNIDRWPSPPHVEGAICLTHDLAAGLPVAPGSCALIYSSHLLEHLPAASGEALLRDCLSALRPGGRLRLCVPDLRLIAKAYVDGDAGFFARHLPREQWPIESAPGGETIIDWVNFGIYQGGEHHCMYDTEKLLALLPALGFSSAIASEFDSAIDLDREVRRAFSLYVDAFA